MSQKNPLQQLIALVVLCVIIGIIGGLKELITGEKKKEKEDIEKHKQATEKKKTRDCTDEEIKKLVVKAKAVYKSLLTPEYKKKIRAAIDQLFEEEMLDPVYDKEYYHNSKIPTPVFQVEDWYIIVFDEDQMIRSYISFVLDDICKEVKKDPEFKQYQLDVGDGDEGCIYPLMYINDQD